MSVGALEPQFYDTLRRAARPQGHRPGPYDLRAPDELRKVIAERFEKRTQAEWAELFEGTDACVAGVIPISEAKDHPHLKARAGVRRARRPAAAAPAPRFSRTGRPCPAAGAGRRHAHPRGAHGLGDRRRRRADRAGAAVQA